MSSDVHWVKECQQGEYDTVVEGETRTITVQYPWANASPSSVSAKVYKEGSDITSTVMPSGSTAVSGKTATLKPLVVSSGDGEMMYIVAVTATVDGDVLVRKIRLYVDSPSSE